MSWLLVIAGVVGVAIVFWLLTKVPIMFQVLKHALAHLLGHLLEPLLETEWFLYAIAAVLWFAILAVIVVVLGAVIYFLP